MALRRLRIDELANAWVGDASTPFQLGLLGLFDAGPWSRADGAIDIEGVALELTARARCVDELRRRVLWTRPWEGRALWVEDPRFDPARHIEHVTLGATDDLTTWAANRCVDPLDLHAPLWRAVLVDGLPEGRFAVLLVVHHILIDGLAGVRLAGSLFDPSRDAVPSDVPAQLAPPLPSHGDLVRDQLRTLRAPHRRRHPPDAPRGHPMAGFRHAMEGFRAPLPSTSLPRRVGPRRRAVSTTEPLETIKRTGHALGATVNDLVLAMVTDGLRELLSGRGELERSLFLRTTVPVATGRTGQAMGMLVVDLPVGEPNPRQRLALITRTTTAGKARLRATGDDVTAMLHVPVPLMRPLVRWGRRLGSSRINLSVSNVPGPDTDVWLAGARMQRAVPIAPLVPLVPLSAAALSYAGSMTISINADTAVTDLAVIAPAMKRSLRRYQALA